MVDEKINGDGPADGGSPDYPADHIGWSLWLGARIWHEKFVGAVRALGHDWFTMSSSTLLGNLSRKGASQTVLSARLGLSKQAVNQQIDDLVAAGVLVREVSAKDKRVRIIRYTAKGNAALVEIDRVKLEIETTFAQIIGVQDMRAIKRAVDKLEVAQKAAVKNPPQTG